MATSQTVPQGTKEVTRKVFDLASFDTVELTKTIQLPTKPATIEDALAAVGNDKERLLSIIYEGMVSDSVEAAKADISGFRVIDEDDKPGDLYLKPVLNEDGTPKVDESGNPVFEGGKFADEDMSKKINGVVLAIAKMQGFDKSLPVEKKRAMKDAARDFIRSNPAMLQSISK